MSSPRDDVDHAQTLSLLGHAVDAHVLAHCGPRASPAPVDHGYVVQRADRRPQHRRRDRGLPRSPSRRCPSVRELIGLGYVAQTIDAADRRRRPLELTASGHRAVAVAALSGATSSHASGSPWAPKLLADGRRPGVGDARARPATSPDRPTPGWHRRPIGPDSISLQDDDGRGDAGVVGEREVHRGDAQVVGAGRATVPRSSNTRPAGGLGDHLGVVPGQSRRAPERLGDRLLGREAGGERGRRPRRLGGGEQPLAQPGVRSRDSMNRAMSTTSMPTPTIISALTRP